MSEIKAQQLADYLAQFPALPDTPLTTAPPVKRRKPDHSANPELLLVTTAAKLLGEMSHILLRTPAAERRSRLSRQFDTMGDTLMPFIGIIPRLPEDTLPTVQTMFDAILAAFRETRTADKFTKKAQGDLADKLEDFHAALAALTVTILMPETP